MFHDGRGTGKPAAVRQRQEYPDADTTRECGAGIGLPPPAG
jgi:hypothetical protein